jgi:hypothetical protein
VVVTVMVGLGSGTVRMSEDVTWPAVVLVVGGAPPAEFVSLDVRTILLDEVAEGLPWGVALPDGTIVLAPVVVIALAVRALLSVEEGVILPDGTVVLAPVVVIALAVGMLLLSVEGEGRVVLPDGVVLAPVVVIALAVSVLLLLSVGGVVFPPVGVMSLGPVDVVVIVGVIPVLGSDIVGVVGVVGVEGGVVGGGADVGG